MQKMLLFVFILSLAIPAQAQINMADSTVQVIGYWDIKDSQSYSVTSKKFRIKDSDTTSKETWTYEVDILVTDSSADSYTIEWTYKNYQVETDNPLVKKLSAIAEDIRIVVKTDELGVLLEVINWQEVRDAILKATAILREEFAMIPNIEAVIAQVELTYDTKEAIEAGAIKDMQQYYTFHGGAYLLGEQLTGNMQLPNLYGGAPFDSEVRVWLDEIDKPNNNYIIRMEQSVNSEQLTNATYAYLQEMSKNLETPLPDRADFPPLRNITYTASRIHATGWVIYSVETKEIELDNTLSIEERVIQIN